MEQWRQRFHSGFCVLGSWALLPVMMGTLLATTAGVVALLAHVIGPDGH